MSSPACGREPDHRFARATTALASTSTPAAQWCGSVHSFSLWLQPSRHGTKNTTLGQSRVLDVWIQIALIFSGVMGVLGLLSEKHPGKQEEILQ